MAVLAWAMASPVHTQTYASGAQTRRYHSAVDDTDQPYALYLPKNFDPQRKYPLVVSLHAEETNHAVNLVQLFGLGIPPTEIGLAVGRGFPRLPDVDYIIACPFARGSIGYQGIAERDVYDVLAEVERLYPVDPDRVYLTGISMGGGGALRLALTNPDIWAGVVAVCPGSLPASESLAPNALNVPIRIYHGDQDIAVPVAYSRAWQRLLAEAGDPVEYFELPGFRHNVWDTAYKAHGEFDWFSTLHRNPLPSRVRLVAREYRYASAYWIALDDFAPGQYSRRERLHHCRPRARPSRGGYDRWRRPPTQGGRRSLLHQDQRPLETGPRGAGLEETGRRRPHRNRGIRRSPLRLRNRRRSAPSSPRFAPPRG